MKQSSGLTYQEQFYSDKVNLIVGVDEAGRGPLAGPVVAAAVIFPRAYINKEINDSKQLSEKKREKLSIRYGTGRQRRGFRSEGMTAAGKPKRRSFTKSFSRLT